MSSTGKKSGNSPPKLSKKDEYVASITAKSQGVYPASTMAKEGYEKQQEVIKKANAGANKVPKNIPINKSESQPNPNPSQDTFKIRFDKLINGTYGIWIILIILGFAIILIGASLFIQTEEEKKQHRKRFHTATAGSGMKLYYPGLLLVFVAVSLAIYKYWPY